MNANGRSTEGLGAGVHCPDAPLRDPDTPFPELRGVPATHLTAELSPGRALSQSEPSYPRFRPHHRDSCYPVCSTHAGFTTTCGVSRGLCYKGLEVHLVYRSHPASLIPSRCSSRGQPCNRNPTQTSARIGSSGPKKPPPQPCDYQPWLFTTLVDPSGAHTHPWAAASSLQNPSQPQGAASSPPLRASHRLL